MLKMLEWVKKILNAFKQVLGEDQSDDWLISCISEMDGDERKYFLFLISTIQCKFQIKSQILHFQVPKFDSSFT